MRWRIEVECSPSADDLPIVQHMVENAVEFVAEALTDLGMEPAVEATLVP